MKKREVSDPKWALGIDTSSKYASSTLLCKGIEVGTSSVLSSPGHSSTILPIVSELLKLHSIIPEYLGLVSVCVGPGQFTGIRVGISTALGIAEVDEIPIVGISSLKALATLSPITKRPIDILIYSRKEEVFYQRFHCELGIDGYILKEETEPEIKETETIIDILNSSYIKMDDRIELSDEVIGQLIERGCVISRITRPLSLGVARAGYEVIKERGADELATSSIEPLYLRKVQAEKRNK